MNHRIKQCVQTLILEAPFFATLILHATITPDHSIDTFSTDGTNIKYSPAFLHTLDDSEVTFVLAHEVMHCALGHCHRQGSREHEQWNRACDYVINLALINDPAQTIGIIKMPVGGLLDRQFADMSADQIYDLIPASPPNPQPNPCGELTQAPDDQQGDDSGEGEGEGEGDDQEDGEGSGGMSEADWEIAAMQAVNAQKMSDGVKAGNAASDLERMIREKIDPAIPWTELLAQFTDAITRDDYTWKIPSARYLHTGFFLPTLRTESIGHIVIAIDTSGSINDRLLAQFLHETQHLLDSARPARITIMSCDWSVHNVQEFVPGDDLTSYKPKGGGGTDFQPVFDHIEENDIDPLALVYFTDGQASFPPEPHYPTLWLHFGWNVTYPFGQVIKLPAA